MSLTVGSLFSGIGGLDLGLERAGMEIRWFSEIEPFCSEVLAHHWPGIPNHGDITKIDWSTVEPVDVLCGGFPCQDISFSGLGAGIQEGTRSGLWSYYADAIRVLRPRFAVIENVAAILVRGLDRVLSDLAGIGYDAEWEVLRACDFGAPHRRSRLFVVAYPVETISGTFCIMQRGPILSAGPLSWQSYGTMPQSAWLMANGAAASRDDGFSDQLDAMSAYGNAVVPQCAEYVGRCIMEAIA